MNKIVIASTSRSAGKTSVAVGIARASRKRFGYMKPFGDRLIYEKKKPWDYDAALMERLFSLDEKPEDISLGFMHAKLQYVLDEKKAKAQVSKMVKDVGKKRDVVFIEGGCDLSFGASVHLDAIALTNYVGGKLLLIADGSQNQIMDELAFIRKYLDVENVKLSGVIINKVKNVSDFRDSHLEDIEDEGIRVFGILPYKAELTHMPVKYLSEHLFAKLIAGEEGASRIIKNIFVADMPATAAIQNPLFKKEGLLVITSGSRTDTIIAALEHDASCVVLADNIMPPTSIISKAEDADVPLLLAPSDAYHTAMQIEHIEPLLTKGDAGKISILENMLKNHVKIKEIIGE
jgi:BioD-like phosphotransacetylase family protein